MEPGGTVGDEGESKRKIVLFEWVSFVCRASIHVNPLSELSRKSRTNYDPYLNALVQLATRKTMQIDILWVNSPKSLGMLSSNIRLALIPQSPAEGFA